MGKTRESVVFFDAASTLLRPHPGVGALYSQVAGEFGLEVDAAALELAFPGAWRAARRQGGPSPYGTSEAQALAFWRGTVQATFEAAGVRMPEDPFFDTLYRRFADHRRWRLYDDALPALAAARMKGARLGLISNFDGRLRPILEGKGLDRILDVIIVSCEAGAEKPDAAVFAAAAQAAGADSSALHFVGDQRVDDYEGATRAGWRACLVDRSSNSTLQGVPAFPCLVAAVEYLLA